MHTVRPIVQHVAGFDYRRRRDGRHGHGLDTEHKCIQRSRVVAREHERAIACVQEVIGKQPAQRLHQVRRADEVHGVPRRLRGLPGDADRAPGFRLRSDAGRLAPIQRFFNIAHASGCGRNVEDQLAQRQQRRADTAGDVCLLEKRNRRRDDSRRRPGKWCGANASRMCRSENASSASRRAVGRCTSMNSQIAHGVLQSISGPICRAGTSRSNRRCP